MPHLWLRLAVVLYAFGLAYALLALSNRGQILSRIVLPAMSLGAVFHFVSLMESTLQTGHFAPVSIHQSESLLAFVLMLFFGGVYARYKTLSPGIFVFPLVFLLAITASFGQNPPQLTPGVLRSGWIAFHIAFIFAGYAALFISFAASVLYLRQEKTLKTKRMGSWFARLPSLEVIDDMGYRSLLFGFPFMTLGLIAGSVIAQSVFGAGYFRDPKVLLSLLMWAVYLVLLFTRWNSGWRGRRAAVLASVAFVTAAGAWAANFISSVHGYVAR
jgi:ABC-type uncharacterized transport system permease subunit